MTREEEKTFKAAEDYAERNFPTEDIVNSKASINTRHDIAFHSFLDGVKYAEEHPKSPWISVKDKLPKCVHTTIGGSFSDMCLCMTQAGEYIPLALNEVCEDDEGLSYYWGTCNDVYDEEVNGEITHWMPIPPLND